MAWCASIVGFAYILVASKSQWFLKIETSCSRVTILENTRLRWSLNLGVLLPEELLNKLAFVDSTAYFLMEVDRAGHVRAAVEPTERLEEGDRLVFVGVVDSVIELRKYVDFGRPQTKYFN